MFVAASMLVSISEVPITNKMLATNRVKLPLNFGSADWIKPKATPVVPASIKTVGLFKIKLIKKYKLAIMMAIIAPTSKPEHVAQKSKLPILKTCVA